MIIMLIYAKLKEEPYMMLVKSKAGDELKGNDRFEGYCKDMMDLIAEKLDIKCKQIDCKFIPKLITINFIFIIILFIYFYYYLLIFLIKDEIRLVKDDRYGNENPNVTGGWDGIIGELIRKVN